MNFWPSAPDNMPIKLSVRAVTGLACASPAPSRPAAYRRRWTVSDHDFPESGFGRIFLGTQ
jgi:hypothetical protein